VTVVDAPDLAGAGRAHAGATVDPGAPDSTVLCTDRGDLFALRAGHGPAVLFLHGVTANAYVWEPVLRRLADRFTVVAVDQRGHGRTGLRGADPSSATTWDAASYAADALSAARAIGDDPVLLVGHSLGARNALVAAVGDPSLVAGVIAIDFTPYIEESVFDALDARVASGGTPFADLPAVEDALRQRYPNLPSDAITRRACHGFRDDGSGWVPLADPIAVASTCAGLRTDLATTLREVSVPILLVRGADSALVSPRAWQKSTALRPDVNAIEIEGADHYVPEERPEVMAQAIARFASERARWRTA